MQKLLEFGVTGGARAGREKSGPNMLEKHQFQRWIRFAALLSALLAPLLSLSIYSAQGDPRDDLSRQYGLSNGESEGLLAGRLAAKATNTSQDQAPRPPEERAARDNDATHLLLFKAGTLDTRFPSLRPNAATTEAGEALHIIQFEGPIRDAWLEAVRATGARLVHYVANNGYLVWADADAREALDRLAVGGTAVTFSSPYPANLKRDRAAPGWQVQAGAAGRPQDNPLQQVRSAEKALLAVTIQLLRHEGDGQSKAVIDTLVEERDGQWRAILNYQNLRAVVTPAALDEIANLPDVLWIEPTAVPELHDERQGQILAGNWTADQSEPSNPGYLDWLLERGFSDDPQQYPIIDITDDGIGTGDAATAAGDRTLRRGGSWQQESRIAYLLNCTDEADGGGPDGHGHLNASIAGGYDERAGAPFQDVLGYQRGLGINPFGRIAGTRVFNTRGSFDIRECSDGFPRWESYLGLVAQSYRSGARLISNSWGCSTCQQYDGASQAYDTAVRDADPEAPGNQEMTILFSAGNGGAGGRVGSPANAKNVITVGASENVRPTWTDGCRYGPVDADNLQDIAVYSSRGPAPGERVKPDLVAPGTHITGTASTNAFYNGSAICDAFYPVQQRLFAASTGTSHSVPAVAGMASLAAFWLEQEHDLQVPSPALLKAFLIVSAAYLTGEGTYDEVTRNSNLPSNSQGYGLPSLRNAFGDSERIIVDQAVPPQFSETAQSWRLSAIVADNQRPVRVVLAYSDQPGLLPAADPRVNDLDLLVEVDDLVYLGNEMEGQWSQPRPVTNPANNVEAVFLPPGTATEFALNVRAANIGGDGVPGNADQTDQDFALVCDNCRMEAEPARPFQFFLPFARR